jgi:hypothetical protein
LLSKIFSSKWLHLEFKILLLILSLFGAISILIGTEKLGIGLTPDSVNYIATARNISCGNGITSFDDKPLIMFPPLYPICLGIIKFIFNTDPLNTAIFFNAILFGLIIYISGLLLFRYLNSSALYSLLGAVSILVGIPLIMVSQFAMSETLFICLISMYLIASEVYLQKGNSISLLLLAFVVALACLTRYIGVVLIITGSLNIIFSRKTKLSIKRKHIYIFAIVTIIPILSFLIRNYILTKTFWGFRESSNYNILQNIKLTLNTILSWFIPQRILFYKSIIILVIIIITILFSWLIIKNRASIKKFCLNKINLFTIIIFYLGFLIITSSLVSYNEIGNRLLSPVFIPITILLVILASKSLNLFTKTLPGILRIIVLFSVIFIWYVLWFSYYLHFTLPVFSNTMTRELGYNGFFWTNNQTINYLREKAKLDNQYPVYSNEPFALYILANMKSEIIPNFNGLFNGLVVYKKVNNISALKGIWPGPGNSYLIWFNRYTYLEPNLFKLNELNLIAELKQIVRLDDGAIYLIKRR